MSVKLVLRGIGKGSLFKHGRVLGVHNPFSNNITKARDPFINLKTLARLSFHSDQAVKDAVALNLGTKALNDLNFRGFNPLF